MADNVAYTPGSGATIAADDVGGVLHQRMKVSIGVDGAAADLAFGQATKAASLPVTVASDQDLTAKMPGTWEKYTSPSSITDTADDAAFAAAGVGVKHYVAHFSAMCDHASTGTWVLLKDGSTVVAQGYCAAAGGGFVINFDPPLPLTANTAVNVANETTGSSTRVNVAGYQAA